MIKLLTNSLTPQKITKFIYQFEKSLKFDVKSFLSYYSPILNFLQCPQIYTPCRMQLVSTAMKLICNIMQHLLSKQRISHKNMFNRFIPELFISILQQQTCKTHWTLVIPQLANILQ